MAQRLDALDSGSNYNFGDKLLTGSHPASVFSLSHNNSISFPKNSNGMLIPILCLRTVPTDQFHISVQSLLRVLPQVVPMYARQRLYLHGFYARGADLWNSFNVFASKGYNGKRNLTIPPLNASIVSDPEAYITADSLFHFLYGLPIGHQIKEFFGKVSALPALLYYKIWRDYYMNKNFYMDDRVILPDDDADFRLDNQGKLISAGGAGFALDQWLFRDFADDFFTSALPSTQRGERASLPINFGDLPVKLGDGSVFPHDIYNYTVKFNPGTGTESLRQEYLSKVGEGSTHILNHSRASANAYHHWANPVSKSLNGYFFVDTSANGVDISLEDLRRLAINQSELERMAHTDGSYREFGLSFFGISSKTAIDYRPVYIGGTYQPIVFSEVLQTVPYEKDNVKSPLGTYGGHGISANNGNLGSIYCDDYGYIMVVASIMPDTYYSQGIERQFTELTQAELLLPDRAKLGMVPILNKELYFQNNDDDDDLFAYQDIFDDYRYHPNVVHGALADPDQKEFFPYTQSRYFTSKPTYSQSFATTKDNVRMDFLAAPDFIPYTCQFGFNIRAVRPLPYRAIPANLL